MCCNWREAAAEDRCQAAFWLGCGTTRSFKPVPCLLRLLWGMDCALPCCAAVVCQMRGVLMGLSRVLDGVWMSRYVTEQYSGGLNNTRCARVQKRCKLQKRLPSAVRSDIQALLTNSQDFWPADFGNYGENGGVLVLQGLHYPSGACAYTTQVPGCAQTILPERLPYI
jgi:hypothetical protein